MILKNWRWRPPAGLFLFPMYIRHAGSFVVASRGRGLRAAGNSYGSDQGVDALPRSENEKQLRVAFFFEVLFFCCYYGKILEREIIRRYGETTTSSCVAPAAFDFFER